MKEIRRLRDNLVLKHSIRFLPNSGRNLMAKLQENSCSGVDEEYMETTAVKLCKISKEYLEQWTLLCEELQIYEWANLTKITTWEEIQTVIDELIEKDLLIFYLPDERTLKCGEECDTKFYNCRKRACRIVQCGVERQHVASWTENRAAVFARKFLHDLRSEVCG
ncbi:hypothetical protein ILUMI_04851 [Ignelater luminosus]|uniref:Uncharacterized protein n=1 Tax=Ignelater luminosus TaxID=2038154 RepID=A0A8K0GIN4_IGNLU|nr:hypothetical protein ILUMI_04851 [Ignelater luminosus]